MRTFFWFLETKLFSYSFRGKTFKKNSQKNPEYRTNLPDQQKKYIKEPLP